MGCNCQGLESDTSKTVSEQSQNVGPLPSGTGSGINIDMEKAAMFGLPLLAFAAGYFLNEIIDKKKGGKK